jgi:hypothetical protein
MFTWHYHIYLFFKALSDRKVTQRVSERVFVFTCLVVVVDGLTRCMCLCCKKNKVVDL